MATPIQPKVLALVVRRARDTKRAMIRSALKRTEDSAHY